MNRPWMPWYIADYLADTAHLRAAQSGAYLHLIMHYWQRGGLPTENVQLAAIARMTDAEWKKARPIIEPFFQMPGWKHKRVEEELAKSLAKYEARAAAGKKGGEAKAEAKQNPSNATANDVAELNQPLSQPPSKSNPESKTRERTSPSKNFDVIEGGGDGPKPIDESYEPSERAVEYAFSLGMKKADLNSEHSKFIAWCMARRVVSFNPDMNFKLWCDRWLEQKLKSNPNWKPEPETPAGEPVKTIFVVRDTLGWKSWVAYIKDTRNMNWSLTTVLHDDETGREQVGWWWPNEFAPGYDEATGEKLAPANEENAA